MMRISSKKNPLLQILFTVLGFWQVGEALLVIISSFWYETKSMGSLNMIILMVIMKIKKRHDGHLLQIGSHELFGAGEVCPQSQFSLSFSPEPKISFYKGYSPSFRFLLSMQLDHSQSLFLFLCLMKSYRQAGSSVCNCKRCLPLWLIRIFEESTF